MPLNYLQGIKILCILLVCIPTQQVFGGQSLVLTSYTKDFPLEPVHLDLLEDKNQAWSIEQVSSADFAGKYVSHSARQSIHWNSCYWVRFRVVNHSDEVQSWLLESYDFTIDEMTLFSPSGNGKFRKKMIGDVYPFEQKEIKHKNLVFQISGIPAKQAQTYYLRIRTVKPFSLILLMRPNPGFIHYALNEYYLLGVFYGILAAICLINLFFFLTIWDFTYLYYVVYVLCIVFFAASHDGTGFQYLWPEHPEVNHVSIRLSILLMVVSSLIYTRSFFKTYQYTPKLDKLIWLVVGIKVLLYGVMLLEPHIFTKIVVDISPVFLAYFVGIIYWKRSYSLANYFVLAYTFLFAGYIILCLWNLGLIAGNVYTFYAFNVGSLLEMLFLSVALANRFKILKKEKELAQEGIIEQLRENEILKDQVTRELEQKVQERTEELSQAYEEIQRMNVLLNADNKNLAYKVEHLNKARVTLKEISFEEFRNIYSNEEACYQYLADVKWKYGYKCRKCGNTNFSRGKYVYSRRCTACGYDESVTAYTIFFRLKFPIVKAFYIVFLVISRKDITLEQLSQMLDLRKMTCSAFKQKVVKVLAEKTKGKQPRYRKDFNDWGPFLLTDYEG
jgi:hypothetical protein